VKVARGQCLIDRGIELPCGERLDQSSDELDTKLLVWGDLLRGQNRRIGSVIDPFDSLASASLRKRASQPTPRLAPAQDDVRGLDRPLSLSPGAANC
jgi:hypothetical protein